MPLTPQDLYLFNEGTHLDLYRALGAHVEREAEGSSSTRFAVWAPEARRVSVLGDFDGWDPLAHPLESRGSSGVWECRVPSVGHGALYKFHIEPRHGGGAIQKADPFAFCAEEPPRTASVVWDLGHAWDDDAWMARPDRGGGRDRPVAIYEVHAGSFDRVAAEGNRRLGYRELAHRLADHVGRLGYTHVELLPVMEHPFFGSWGYQTTSYFAPSRRQGDPQDFMYLVDHLHRRGIGVILDLSLAHFPDDPHGLGRFDGSCLYEHADPRRGRHPDWASLCFNYGRREVACFLTNVALFWLEVYHADGLRVDGVASMLYLDYSRRPGEWVPNERGGREDLEAVAFLRRLNEAVYLRHPAVQTYAEESTAWPLVSRPTSVGGLGFGYKWDMGWMHDTLAHLSRAPVHRRFHHRELSFRGLYAWSENFVLPLSHDEVVHGKRSLLGRMGGDRWQRLAGLRLLLGWQYAQPGKKLLFMGGEWGSWGEWDHEAALDWALLDHPDHAGLARWVADLNRAYRALGALHEGDCETAGFRWVSCDDADQSCVAFLRLGRPGSPEVLCAFNFTPVPRHGYRLGVPRPGAWREVLNGDARDYGGSGLGNLGASEAAPEPSHGLGASLELALPPLAAIFLVAPAEGPPP
ncbi:MAG: 1,4-alpha-glucan branching protein GlgB [Planctomycetes bacterium]|nr:1,4-alpha-glucan branching protein GlgB [Planctomycetota bacterium]